MVLKILILACIFGLVFDTWIILLTTANMCLLSQEIRTAVAANIAEKMEKEEDIDFDLEMTDRMLIKLIGFGIRFVVDCCLVTYLICYGFLNLYIFS